MPPRLMSMSQGAPASSPPKTNASEYGLYKDAKWFCNCSPRQRAVYFPVTKDSANKGRCFWACPDQYGGCNFFLWREDAEKRSGTMGAVEAPRSRLRRASSDQSISKFFQAGAGSRNTATNQDRAPNMSQPQPVVKDLFGDDFSSEDEEALAKLADAAVVTPAPQRSESRPIPPVTPPTFAPEQTNKRKFDVVDLLSDESSDEERLATEILQKSTSRILGDSPSTPSQSRTHSFTGGLATPISKHKPAPVPPASQAAKRQRVEATPSSGPHVTFQSPAPLSSQSTGSNNPFLASSSPTPPSSQQGDNISITQEIMTLLKSQRIEPLVLRAVQDNLNKFDMKVKGIVAARDMLRQNKKMKEEKIAKLQEQVAHLEAKAKATKDRHTALRAKVMQIYQES